MQYVLQQYGIEKSGCDIMPLTNGLINTTWMVNVKGKKYILQKINHAVFKQPADIAFNVRCIGNYLQQHYPDYLFTTHVQTVNGEDLVIDDENYFRLFSFIENSHTITVVEKPEQAFEAAKQFGRFTNLLSKLDAAQLKTTLPDFHNLPLRYSQFEAALQKGNPARIKEAKELVIFLQQQKIIVEKFEQIKQQLSVRVTHHDTKISNVLFDENNKGLCVIDLDTVMPGYFISDVGDMFRTYLSPVSEEEKDFSKICIRKEFYAAIVEGYLSEMGEELTVEEKKYIPFAGQFMMYMQALRFLTDYINNDIYYGSKYEGHNLIRAGNQVALMQKFNAFIAD